MSQGQLILHSRMKRGVTKSVVGRKERKEVITIEDYHPPRLFSIIQSAIHY